MPLFDMPADAVDRVYAESIFELAEQHGGQSRLEDLSGEFDEFVELTRQNTEFSEFLSSQIVNADEREATLKSILGHGRVSDLFLQFILVLNNKGRLSRLLSIITAYQSMLQERFGRVEVDVYTRHPLGQDQVQNIRQQLATALSRDVVIYPYVDENMIGGIKMQIGDRLFDDSFSMMLRNMRGLFRNEGTALVRSKAQQIIDDNA